MGKCPENCNIKSTNREFNNYSNVNKLDKDTPLSNNVPNSNNADLNPISLEAYLDDEFHTDEVFINKLYKEKDVDDNVLQKPININFSSEVITNKNKNKSKKKDT